MFSAMILNRKTTPSLKMLDAKICDHPDFGFSISNVFETFRDDFKSNIVLLSDSFFNFAHQQGKKISETCLFGKSLGMLDVVRCQIIKNVTIAYYISSKVEDGKDVFYVVMYVSNDGERVDACAVRISGAENEMCSIHVSSTFTIDSPNAIFECAMTLVSVELFLKYGKTETVVVESGKANRKGKVYEVKNLCGYPIKYIDSSWVREIVRLEGFKVSGHFRMQPCKVDGVPTYRLIYINEYEKHGYHRRARKEIC